MFHESFMEGEVSWIFQGCFMIFKVVFRVFQGGFKKTLKVFQKKFHVAWHSSQLPEQKEGLFSHFTQFSLLANYKSMPLNKVAWVSLPKNCLIPWFKEL